MRTIGHKCIVEDPLIITSLDFCTLDFQAACLTTSAGFVAAGGQHSELDIRPLFPLPSNPTSGNGTASTSGSNVASLDRSHAGSSAARAPPRWHLRTPTGGSINNSIYIQPDLSVAAPVLDDEVTVMGETGEEKVCEASQRGKRKMDADKAPHMHSTVHRRKVDPVRKNTEGMASKAYLVSDIEGRIGWNFQTSGAVSSYKSSLPCQRIDPDEQVKSVRVLVSNNDRSFKAYRLRPPSRRRGVGSDEKIESDLPGLSRTQSVHLSTSINHSSFSPDGHHIVSVGDTPDVFLFSVDKVTGEISQIGTYTASSDASFYTAWSPDSLQFAVASQDGVISVWDVRSSSKIAQLNTTHRPNSYRPEAARVVKWSPSGHLLAFTEDSNYVHIVETVGFTEVQRLKMPTPGHANAGASAHPSLCVQDQGQDSEPNADISDILMSLHHDADSGSASRNDGQNDVQNPSTSVGSDWVGLTSPSRFSSNGRAGASSNAAVLTRPWTSGRRYRDIGNPLGRVVMDRVLLGEWGSSRRVGEGTRNTPLQDNSEQAGSSESNERESSWQQELAQIDGHSSVDSFLANLSEVTERSTAVWGMSPLTLGRRRALHNGETNIVGMTWDPDGDFLYVSTQHLIARYKLLDQRRSFGQVALR